MYNKIKQKLLINIFSKNITKFVKFKVIKFLKKIILTKLANKKTVT